MNKLPALSAPNGRQAAYIVVAVDFPLDTTPAVALEDFVRLGDKWYGPNSDMRMKCVVITTNPTALAKNDQDQGVLANKAAVDAAENQYKE